MKSHRWFLYSKLGQITWFEKGIGFWNGHSPSPQTYACIKDVYTALTKLRQSLEADIKDLKK